MVEVIRQSGSVVALCFLHGNTMIIFLVVRVGNSTFQSVCFYHLDNGNALNCLKSTLHHAIYVPATCHSWKKQFQHGFASFFISFYSPPPPPPKKKKKKHLGTIHFDDRFYKASEGGSYFSSLAFAICELCKRLVVPWVLSHVCYGINQKPSQYSRNARFRCDWFLDNKIVWSVSSVHIVLVTTLVYFRDF